nr:hypothetical protein [Deltaproteobacteria bacterium]
MADSVTITAEIISIDLVDRVLALLGPGGGLVEIKVGQEVESLNHVELGDQVRVEYIESMAFLSEKKRQPRKATKKSRSPALKNDIDDTGIGREIVDGPATVESMDRKTRRIKLRTPDGKLFTTNVDRSVALFES